MSVEILLIDAISSKYSPPPEDNKLHNSEPTCSSGLCHFLSQPAGMVISALLLAAEATSVATRLQRPPGWMTWAPWQQPERGRNINVIFSLCVEVHISKGNEMVRPAPLRAHSHDGFLL